MTSVTVQDVVFPNLTPEDSVQINESLRSLENRVAWLERNTTKLPEHYVDGECSRSGRMVIVPGQTYTAVALRDTCDPPYIYPLSNPFWATGLGDTDIGFNYVSGTFNLKYRANEFVLSENKHYKISKIRFLVPHDQLTQSYTLFYETWDEFDQAWDQTQILGNFKATGKGTWIEYGYTSLWRGGRRHRVAAHVISESTLESFTGFWSQKNQNGDPSEGEMNFQNSQTQMRFHNVDKNDVDWSSFLGAVVAGATITRGSQVWTVQAVDVRSSHVRYDVAPGGQRGSEDDYNFTFEQGSSAPLVHAEYPNLWVPNPDTTGASRDNNAAEVITQDQYMVDVYGQQIDMSPDWQIISLS